MKTPEKFYRLKELGSERLDVIETMLVAGKPASEVADKVRDDWLACRDISRESLIRQLNRYREDLESEAVGKQLALSKSSSTQRAAIKAAERYDTIGLLTRLVRIGERRLTRQLVQEEKMPVLMASVREELKVVADLAVKLANLQMETGMLRRAPKQLQALVGMVDPDGALMKFEAEIQQTAQTREAIADIVRIIKATDDELPLLEAPYEDAEYEEIPELSRAVSR